MLQKLIATASVLVLLVAATSCSTDPVVAKKKHVDAGARYLKAAKYREAMRIPSSVQRRRDKRCMPGNEAAAAAVAAG